MVKHNHITRNVKPKGECPACDEMYKMRLAQPRLTKWEAGQELTKANDALIEAIVELKKYPDCTLWRNLEDSRKLIVETFNQGGFVEEMGFGI